MSGQLYLSETNEYVLEDVQVCLLLGVGLHDRVLGRILMSCQIGHLRVAEVVLRLREVEVEARHDGRSTHRAL